MDVGNGLLQKMKKDTVLLLILVLMDIKHQALIGFLINTLLEI